MRNFNDYLEMVMEADTNKKTSISDISYVRINNRDSLSGITKAAQLLEVKETLRKIFSKEGEAMSDSNLLEAINGIISKREVPNTIKNKINKAFPKLKEEEEKGISAIELAFLNACKNSVHWAKFSARRPAKA
jgi:histidyl-tRNA synthetase